MMQDKGLKRNQADKFYTKNEIVKICLDKVKEHIAIKENDCVIEPSAGSGSFSIPLSNMYKNVIPIDILPENDDIRQQDFLEFDHTILQDFDSLHVIGNPPFGRQSSLAKKFIKKSAAFANSISFILPKSFKKESFSSVFPLNFHMVECLDLPKNSFQINGKDYDVPCVFQIWTKKTTKREIKKIEKADFYEYVKKDDDPDVSIRRVGINSGEISQEYQDKSIQSHYFLRLKTNIDSFIKIYKEHLNFKFDNTVGPRSISKKELDEYICTIEKYMPNN